MDIEGIFDINDESVKTVKDVFEGMYKATTAEGVLKVSFIQNEGYVKQVGYYECQMNKELWAKEFNNDEVRFLRMIKAIKFDDPQPEYLREEYKDSFKSNYFQPFAVARISRIAKLWEIEAPEIVVYQEIKALAYYWILNNYCYTL